MGQKQPKKSIQRIDSYALKVWILCTGDTDAYIKWSTQLDKFIEGKHYDGVKAKLEMVEMMLYGVINDSFSEFKEIIVPNLVTRTVTDKDGGEVKKELE